MEATPTIFIEMKNAGMGVGGDELRAAIPVVFSVFFVSLIIVFFVIKKLLKVKKSDYGILLFMVMCFSVLLTFLIMKFVWKY